MVFFLLPRGQPDFQVSVLSVERTDTQRPRGTYRYVVKIVVRNNGTAGAGQVSGVVYFSTEALSYGSAFIFPGGEPYANIDAEKEVTCKASPWGPSVERIEGLSITISWSGERFSKSFNATIP